MIKKLIENTVAVTNEGTSDDRPIALIGGDPARSFSFKISDAKEVANALLEAIKEENIPKTLKFRDSDLEVQVGDFILMILSQHLQKSLRSVQRTLASL